MEESRMSTPVRYLVWITATAACLAIAWPCTAANLKVPQQYSTLQAAVDAAQPGDVISLAFAFHYGAVLIDGKSDLEIRGGNGPVLPFQIQSIGIHIKNSNNITLNGFVIRNFERAIVIENSSDCTVKGMTVHTNRDISAGSGGFLADGIVLINSTQTDISRNAVYDNGNNGILLTAGSSGNTIRGNTIHGNGWQMAGEVNAGSGIALDGGDQQDNMISGNTVRGNRWGIFLGPDGASSDNQITRNKSTDNARAGIALRGGAEGNLVKANSAAGNDTMDLAPSTPLDIFDDSTGSGGNTFERNKGVVGP
jgi:parallel beta-helix repeat protein